MSDDFRELVQSMNVMTEPKAQTDETWLRKQLLPTIGKYIEAQLKPLRERIAQLESSGIRYCGTYQRASEYRRGDVISYDGSMWVATCATPPQEVPSKSICWQLSVKSR